MYSTKRKMSGFTLMEMLTVVAIIAILVAIMIPVMSNSLHKAKVAADEANCRAYYAAMQEEYLLTGEYDPSITDEMMDNYTDTLKFPDGSTVKLQAGHCAIIRSLDKSGGAHGYQVYYHCDSKDYCEATFGASGQTTH